jgi:hypothetical protein
MANELRIYANFTGGRIDVDLASGGTTISSPGFASLPVVDATNHMLIVLDPDGRTGAPQVVRCTAHTAAATTITVETAAVDGTTARAHKAGAIWTHGTVASDVGKYSRQGGSATDWDVSGTTLRSIPGQPRIEMGVWDFAALGTKAIAFSTAFADKPLVLVSFGDAITNGRSVVRADSVSATGFDLILDNTTAAGATVRWMAVGN